jgi:hypothetical protein
LQFTYVQARAEAFSPQKRTSSTLKNKIYYLFYMFVVIFALLDPDPDTDPETLLNPDPDPPHWQKQSETGQLA